MASDQSLLRIEIHKIHANPKFQCELQARAEERGGQICECEVTEVFWFAGKASKSQVRNLCEKVLSHPLIESFQISGHEFESSASLDSEDDHAKNEFAFTITPLAGLTKTVRGHLQAALDSLEIQSLRPIMRGRCVRGRFASEEAALTFMELQQMLEYWLFNPLVEQVSLGTSFQQAEVQLTAGPEFFDLANFSDCELIELSKSRRLALDLRELQTIQSFYRGEARQATLIELETFAQSWSEHCVHKTFQAAVQHGAESFENLFKETIVATTEQVSSPLTVSVFEDNAGIVRFDEHVNLCFKAETHNHPSAIEPYGGSATGLGGVIRDILGAGLGARPILNTNVFCFADPTHDSSKSNSGAKLSQGYLQSRIIAGLRDYGNRVGVATAAGSVHFHDGYEHNPVVLAGCLGVLPKDQPEKKPQLHDFVVLVGGLTGRDGIHGVNFSSEALQAEQLSQDRSAVQIGQPLMEQKLIAPLLRASEQGLIHSVTDCGGGGLSSAIGEMGSELGVIIDLAKVPLKSADLSPREIWISESQERMVLAVAEKNFDDLRQLFEKAAVPCTAIGSFSGDQHLRLHFQEESLAVLPMATLHGSRPKRQLNSQPPEVLRRPINAEDLHLLDGLTRAWLYELLLACLAQRDVCSRQSIVRQYDHEVQGRTVQGPFAGPGAGPQDGVVVLPRLGSTRGAVIGLGYCARHASDPYRMAANSVDEAFRNVVAAGADPESVVLLDNFIWGDVSQPEQLGGFVEAAKACRDMALALNLPFISGKDSLNNTFIDSDGTKQSINPTLIISALGQTPDVRRAQSIDLKSAGNLILLVGTTRSEFGGSCLIECLTKLEFSGLDSKTSQSNESKADRPADLACFASAIPDTHGSEHRGRAKVIYRLIQLGLVVSCHDCSDGGVLTALAEMCVAGNLGATMQPSVVHDSLSTALFAESSGRYLIEIREADLSVVQQCFRDLADSGSNASQVSVIGSVIEAPQLRLTDGISWHLADLNTAFFQEIC